MKKKNLFNHKNVRFHHRRDYGVSIGIGIDNAGNAFVSLASVKRPGKFKAIAFRNEEDGSMHTIPYIGDQYSKEEARASILTKMNDVYRGNIRSFAVNVGPLNIDSLDAIKLCVKELDHDITTAVTFTNGVSRRDFAETAFSSIISALAGVSD